MNAKQIAALSDEQLAIELRQTQFTLRLLEEADRQRKMKAYKAKLDGITVAFDNGVFRFFHPNGFALEAVNVGEGKRLNQYSHFEIWNLRPKKRGVGYTRDSKRCNMYTTFSQIREMVANNPEFNTKEA